MGAIYDFFFVSNRSLLLRVIENQEVIMAEFEDVDALLNDIKVSTDAQAVKLAAVGTELAAQGIRLQALVDELGTPGGLTPEQLAALAAKAAEIKGAVDAASSSLDDEVATLQATGVDPDDPTP
jgi:hypothetical protein